MPAVPSFIIDPIWEQISVLLPQRRDEHPLGCHRRRVDDRIVFELLALALVCGLGYRQASDARCSASTLRRRRDEWITAGVMSRLEQTVREAYDRMVGLELADLALDGCIVKAPCGGELASRNPVDRGKQGIRRSTVVDAAGIPLGVHVGAANAQDSPLLAPTLDLLTGLGPLPEQVTVHLDRGYDSAKTRAALADRGLHGQIARRGQPAPIQAGQRWVVERTHAWHNALRKLLVCTERRARVIDFWISLANAIIMTRRLVRTVWTTHRWDNRPARRP